MKIGNIELRNNVFFAPMAGYTDMPCRLLAVAEGCGLVYSEMINVIGLCHKGKKTMKLLDIHPEERPIVLQLFGKTPEHFGPAAKIAEEAGADIIDINMGCPMSKVTGGGSGVGLMREPERAREIIRNTVRAVKVPVTVKFRSGWDAKSINVVEMSQMAEQEGVRAIAVHPRTRAQMFTGLSDWSLIKKVKVAVKVPVIGSGDIKTPQHAKRMLDETGCDGVMIGRVALGNPWIFSQTIEYLRSGNIPEPPAFKIRVEMYLEHLRRLVEYKGERGAVPEMRKYVPRYFRDEPGVSELRQQINKLTKLADLEALLLTVLR